MRFVFCTVLTASLAFALAGAAHAVEPLTGTYKDKLRCAGLYNGMKFVESSKDILWYLDDLGDGNLFLHADGGGWKYHGWLEVETEKPSRGIIGFADCNIQSGYPQGEVQVLRVKTKPGKTKVVLRGTGVSFRNFGAAICTHVLTRISTSIPAVVSSCP